MSAHLAIDLGTANTVVYRRGAGVVLDEPSVVAVHIDDGRLLAVGTDARDMLGRTPREIATVQPVGNGLVTDLEMCDRMLRYLISQLPRRRWARPHMVMCIPDGVTGVDRRARQETAEAAGARKPVDLIEESIAAAIGAGLPVHEPAGNMVVDIGGGVTHVAVVSLGGIVASESVRTGGHALDEAIVGFAKAEYALAVGPRTAEHAKTEHASAWPLEEEHYLDLGGRSLETDLPHTVTVSTAELREAIAVPVVEIVDTIKKALDRTPPELAVDIMERGLVITGGSALLHGLGRRIGTEIEMPVFVADRPRHSVALGAGRYLESL
jgi:rod shape-determining protein MreB and related proteins